MATATRPSSSMAVGRTRCECCHVHDFEFSGAPVDHRVRRVT